MGGAPARELCAELARTKRQYFWTSRTSDGRAITESRHEQSSPPQPPPPPPSRYSCRAPEQEIFLHSSLRVYVYVPIGNYVRVERESEMTLARSVQRDVRNCISREARLDFIHFFLRALDKLKKFSPHTRVKFDSLSRYSPQRRRRRTSAGTPAREKKVCV